MSFLSKLFGGGKKPSSSEPELLGREDYNGFEINALAMKQGSEYILSGLIKKEIDGEVKVKKFIRADRLQSTEQACDAALKKGRQIIDQEGAHLFDNPY